MKNSTDSNVLKKDISLSLLEHIIGFSRALLDAGIAVNTSNLIHFCKCFDHIDIANKADFYNAAQATFVSSRDELPRFRQVFSEYWFGLKLPENKDPGEEDGLSEVSMDGGNKDGSMPEPDEENELSEVPTDGENADGSMPESGEKDGLSEVPVEGESEDGSMPESGEKDGQSEEPAEGGNKDKSRSESSEESDTDEQTDQKVPEQVQAGSSENEALLTKDLSELNFTQLKEIDELIRQIAETLQIRNSHRTKSSYTGKDLDQRKMLRDAARCDGNILKLRYRQQKFRKAKLYLLCDVSGSMDRYAGFLIQFIHTIQDRIPGFEVALFSTRMSIVTRFVKQKDIHQALPLLATHVHDWSGGTRIGVSLRQFNHHFSREMSQNRSVVMILSDGWDRGDARLMRNELQNLRRRVHRLIWLNPLLGNKNYRPLARGMRTAIPYLDEFLPFNDINSLKNVVRALKVSFGD